MNINDRISEIKEAAIDLFGADDALIRSFEIREKYLEMYQEFERKRLEGIKYEDALRGVAESFHVSQSTVKKGIQYGDSLVRNK